mmetsp:Transcript_27406/g.64268  ORF Transcript_27406/g.64268 Transcript_27406/m.64268 type:complete len:235 (-) Transcript_27406:39-743(-)
MAARPPLWRRKMRARHHRQALSTSTNLPVPSSLVLLATYAPQKRQSTRTARPMADTDAADTDAADTNAVDSNAADANAADTAPPTPKRSRYSTFIGALESQNVSFGAEADHSNNQGRTLIPTTGNDKASAEEIAAALDSLDHGWANKDFTHDEKCLSVATLKRLQVVVPEAAVEEAEEALEGAEAEEEALVDEEPPAPNAVATDLDTADGDVRSLPASSSGRQRRRPQHSDEIL